MPSARLTRVLTLTLLGGVAAGLAACATIMNGTSQEVSIASTPTGARVTVDDIEMGKTPIVAKLKRKEQHAVKLSLDGYAPYELKFSRGTSGWVWGNLLFGGLPGLAVDAIAGGLYKLKPEQVQAQLAQQGAVVDRQHDLLVVMVTLHPDPEWERIGQLSRR